MQTNFQPYEAHIPFLLQFFVDFNLFGMEFVKFSKAKFRTPLPIRRKRLWRNIEYDITSSSSSGSRTLQPPSAASPSNADSFFLNIQSGRNNRLALKDYQSGGTVPRQFEMMKSRPLLIDAKRIVILKSTSWPMTLSIT